MPGLTPAQVLKREQDRARRESLELHMLHQLRALGLTAGMVQQHRFHESRAWRFDFAWPAHRLALEVDGGTWINGGHSRGSGIAKDCEKLAAAVIAGWRVMRATTNHVTDGTAVRWIEQALSLENV